MPPNTEFINDDGAAVVEDFVAVAAAADTDVSDEDEQDPVFTPVTSVVPAHEKQILANAATATTQTEAVARPAETILSSTASSAKILTTTSPQNTKK